MARRAAAGPEAAGQETARRRTLGGLPWIAVYADHLRHPKCVELAAELGDARAPLHVAAVWYWFAERYPEGAMPDRPALVAALEAAALWPGPAGELVKGLVKVGLLDRRRHWLAVHDWDMYQAAHVERRARDRAYQRRRRAELKLSSPPEEPERERRQAKPEEKPRPDVAPTSPLPSPSPSPSPSQSRSLASDGTSKPTFPSTPSTGNGAQRTGADLALDAEAKAIRALLPAKAPDLAKALGVPAGAIDEALEELRRSGHVRLRGGLVPLWEWVR